MKEKFFELTKKMESDGWEAITIANNTSPRGVVTWFAVMMKGGIHVYIEMEKADRIWLRDVAMECPKCGMIYNEDEHEEFCPDCEVAWDWKREIPADYKQ